ncbi:hypothetical protein [Nocardioides mangrovi]|uniref:Bacterial spore germination immunoglobulin-like domain-containing protein n=1 Tax=Nocardioides mangrovi TaxID=2874580 RepID=A0ABS7U9X7_9ACTN|nr:hypothetical protein [Nocardioides mangrovi]MBZ5737627.1 hypothetical protein [Nocardioides mangrovi]
MSRTLIALLLGLTGLAAAPFPSSPAAAGCAGPQVVVPGVDVARDRPVLTRGSEVTVRGRYFLDGCDDTGGSSATLGCTTDDEGETVQPSRDVELRLNGELVGTADADEDGRITWTFTVPVDLPVGPATMDSYSGDEIRVRIR